MNEGSGTVAADSSGSGYTGTIANGTWSTDRPPVAGAGSYALAFNGSTFVDTAVFDINDDFTIAAWIKPDSRTRGNIIGKHDAAGANQFLFGLYSESYLLNIRDRPEFLAAPVLYDEWHHITLVGRARDGATETTLYRNGVPQWTYNVAPTMGDVGNGLPWTLGRDIDGATPNDFYAGLLSDVRIYDRALNDGEVAARTDGFARVCAVPSAGYPSVGAAVAGFCDIVDIAPGAYEVGRAEVMQGQILRGAGPDETVLTLAQNSTRFLRLTQHATLRDLTLRGRPQGSSSAVGGGGALYIEPRAVVTIDNVTFDFHYSLYDGGAIYNEGALTVVDSRFTLNSAGAFLDFVSGMYGGGGALTVYETAEVNTARSTISGNSVDHEQVLSGVSAAGAILNEGALYIRNSTISGNAVLGDEAETFPRAAILQPRSGGDTILRLIHATVADNGGAVPAGEHAVHAVAGDVRLFGSLLARNGSANCLLETGVDLRVEDTFADDASCAGAAPSGNLQLGPLADNGGPTQTQAIGATSDARDGTSGEWCPGVDQRGFPRAVWACDAGAYEFGGAATIMLPLVLRP